MNHATLSGEKAQTSRRSTALEPHPKATGISTKALGFRELQNQCDELGCWSALHDLFVASLPYINAIAHVLREASGGFGEVLRLPQTHITACLSNRKL